MPKKIFTEEQKKYIIEEYTIKKRTAKDIGMEVGCSNTTLLKNLKEWGISINSRTLDLTNQKFGELTVIKPAPQQNDRYSRWICQCSCGTEVVVRTDYLTNGHTTSCGHLKNQYFKKLDLVGQRFGRLTVLEAMPPESQKCMCDCGNILNVRTSNLTNGNTKSCGCLQKDRTSETSFISLIGNKYGKLTVIERVENNRFGHVCYRCKCDCGGETIVDAGNLRQGITSSCGCVKSKGEMIINSWLQEHGFDFRCQYSFNDCVLSTGRRPFFDFVLFKDKKPYMIIEYNGIQHYTATGGWNTEEKVQDTQRRDHEKLQWCENNHYPVLIIKYDEDIIKLLEENLLQKPFKCLEGLVKAEATEPDMEEAEGIGDNMPN